MRPTTVRLGTAAIGLASAILAGCASITGLDGSSSYACKAPPGVQCDSVTGTYHNAVKNNLPSQRKPTAQGGEPQSSPTGLQAQRDPGLVTTAARAPAGPDAGAYVATPLRSGPKILRLWVKAWEDADRDLNGESVVFVQVDNGHWLVDHVQRQAREPFAPIRPAKQLTQSGKGSAVAGQREQQPQADVAPAVGQALRALQQQARGATPADN